MKKIPINKNYALRKLGNIVTGPLLLTCLILLAQLGLLALVLIRFTAWFPLIYLVCALVSLLVVAGLINRDTEPEFKLSLILPIMTFPLLGGLIYLLFSRDAMGPRMKRRWKAMLEAEAEPSHPLPEDCPALHKPVRYLEQAGFALCPNGGSRYFPEGEELWRDLLESLEGAQKSIFLEYYIIERGEMWDSILEILRRKAAAGLDVRVIYDGVGCITTLPWHYDRKLEGMGIRCRIFNPFVPVLTIRHNNRDHRKIAVIDDRIGYTGGANLADEYINRIQRFGHWKDGGVRLEGESARQLAGSFLTMWQLLTGEQEPRQPAEEPAPAGDGWAMAHSSEPMGDPVIRDLCLQLIAGAQKQLWVYTPYFVPDQATMAALCLAARSGVDVRVMTPHIGDKWYVHKVTRTHYPALIQAGARVFEYTPGFLHTKALLIDGHMAVISSANLDFRSFFMQFEAGVLLQGCAAVPQLERDMAATQERSLEVTADMLAHRRFQSTIIRSLLKLFAPLM